MNNQAKQALIKLKSFGNAEIAEHSKRFFKTGPGEYGEGDTFLGIRVPQVRAIEKEFAHMSPQDTLPLLHSELHEVRLFSLIHLSNLYQRSKKNPQLQDEIYELYLDNTEFINNWDLVDCSAHKIVGPHLQEETDGRTLKELAKSNYMWERRIAMVSCWYYNNKSLQHQITYDIAEMLVYDKHDLMHKAVGWMLREMGKKNMELLLEFLDEYAATMPRTALRYSLEKFDPGPKQHYMDLAKNSSD